MDTTDTDPIIVTTSIKVKDKLGVQRTTATVAVDTSAQPMTANFTPNGGTETACTGVVVWNAGANGTVGWNFKVSGSANGSFPLGAKGADHVYRFTGNQNSLGSAPSGNVNWPGATIEDDDDTWQSGANPDEPCDGADQEAT